MRRLICGLVLVVLHLIRETKLGDLGKSTRDPTPVLPSLDRMELVVLLISFLFTFRSKV